MSDNQELIRLVRAYGKASYEAGLYVGEPYPAEEADKAEKKAVNLWVQIKQKLAGE